MVDVTFATSCFERDWQLILKGQNYLAEKQIANHSFSFKEKIVVINNVSDLPSAISFAKDKVEKNILTNFFVASEQDVLPFFGLKREDLATSWIYYNAIGILTALYFCKTPYFLYLNGDVFLNEKISWIEKAIDLMEKKEKYKVANLTWNYKYEEAKEESFKEERDFFVAKSGFSDQFFLVKTADFKKPIYNEIRSDANHFPRGDVFEKRVYSFMKNHDWLRITYKKGSYIHASIY